MGADMSVSTAARALALSLGLPRPVLSTPPTAAELRMLAEWVRRVAGFAADLSEEVRVATVALADDDVRQALNRSSDLATLAAHLQVAATWAAMNERAAAERAA